MANIRKWTKPGSDEVRYYLDCGFGGFSFLNRHENQIADRRWIGKADDGAAHVYAKGATGRARGEDGPWLDEVFCLTSWQAWEATFAACQTKGGNFSVAKFRQTM